MRFGTMILPARLAAQVAAAGQTSLPGLPSARMARQDFRRMQVKPLGFTAEDIDLIRLGVERREVR